MSSTESQTFVIQESSSVDGLEIEPNDNLHKHQMERCVQILIKLAADAHNRYKYEEEGRRQSSIRRCKGKRQQVLQPHRQGVLIAGERGIGKTTFILSLQRNLDGFANKHGNVSLPKAYVLPILDPNQIDGDEVFLATVVANIIREIDHSLADCDPCGRDHKGKLITAVEKLHTGLLASSNDTWRALMASGGSFSQYAENLHRLSSGGLTAMERFEEVAREACKLLCVDLLVQPIDDIDLGGPESWRVLNSIYKYLSGPSLVPVLCADELHLQLVVQNELFKQDATALGLLKGIQLPDQVISLEKQLQHTVNIRHQFLLKVLPAAHRQRLFSAKQDLLQNGKWQPRNEGNKTKPMPIFLHTPHTTDQVSLLGDLTLSLTPQVSRIPLHSLTHALPNNTRALVTFLHICWEMHPSKPLPQSQKQDDGQSLNSLVVNLSRLFELLDSSEVLDQPPERYIRRVVVGKDWLKAATLYGFRQQSPRWTRTEDEVGNVDDGTVLRTEITRLAINKGLLLQPRKVLRLLTTIGPVWMSPPLSFEQQSSQVDQRRELAAGSGESSAYMVVRQAEHALSFENQFAAHPALPIVRVLASTTGRPTDVSQVSSSWINMIRGALRIHIWHNSEERLDKNTPTPLFRPNSRISEQLRNHDPLPPIERQDLLAFLQLFLVRANAPPHQFLDAGGAIERLLYVQTRSSTANESPFRRYWNEQHYRLHIHNRTEGARVRAAGPTSQPLEPPSTDAWRTLGNCIWRWQNSPAVQNCAREAKAEIFLLIDIAKTWREVEERVGRSLSQRDVSTVADYLEPCILGFIHALLFNEFYALVAGDLDSYRKLKLPLLSEWVPIYGFTYKRYNVGEVDSATQVGEPATQPRVYLPSADDQHFSSVLTFLATMTSESRATLREMGIEALSWSQVLPLTNILVTCPAVRAAVHSDWAQLLTNAFPPEPNSDLNTENQAALYHLLCGLLLEVGVPTQNEGAK